MVLLAHGVLLYDYFTWRKVKKKKKTKTKTFFMVAEARYM